MQISAYLFLHGRTEEVMRFYQSALGGELEISHNRDAPFAADLPKDSLDSVMHATLRGKEFNLMASDNQPASHQERASNVALCIAFDNEETARTAFEKLSTGGTITVPLQKAFWGALFAQFTDKYGTEWMINAA
jgi:PhnB protein